MFMKSTSRIAKNSIKLGIVFMLMFTSTTSASTIISQLLRQEGYNNLGLYTVFVNSAFFMLGGFFAPYYSNKYNSKWCMFAGLSAYTFKLTTYVIIGYARKYEWFVYTLVIFGAAFSGFTACFLWASEGQYIHTLCEREGKQKQKGRYFGLFYQIYSLSNILAGVATTFLLGYYSAQVYFYCLASIGMASLLFLVFFVDKIQKLHPEQTNIIVSVGPETEQQFKGQKQQNRYSPLEVLKFYPQMVVMLPFIGVIGFIMGFYTSSLGDLISQTLHDSSDIQLIRLRIGIGVILLGVGQILGGWLSGKNADKRHIQTIGGIGITLYILVCQLSQLSTEVKNPVFVYFIAFGWGFMHSYIQNWIMVVCSRNYKGRLESFSINKQFHSLTLCFYEIMIIFGTPSISLILTIMTFFNILLIVSLTQLKPAEQQFLALKTAESQ